MRASDSRKLRQTNSGCAVGGIRRGRHYWLAGDADAVLDEVQSFLTGQRGAKPSNRVLSTILFTDIVGSTQRAAELGDDAWTAVLAAHDRTIAEHVGAWRGGP